MFIGTKGIERRNLEFTGAVARYCGTQHELGLDLGEVRGSECRVRVLSLKLFCSQLFSVSGFGFRV